MGDEVDISNLVLPFRIYDWDRYTPVARRTQIETANEILTQYVKILQRLVAAKADPLETVRLWIRTEKLVIEYTSQGFNELLPFQARLRMHIDRAARVLRRVCIRSALKAPPHQNAFWKDAFTKLDTHDIECQEDWDAAVNAVDHGKDLLFNLRGRDDCEVALERRLQREQLAKAGLDESNFRSR
jgi:hypothetical protein